MEIFNISGKNAEILRKHFRLSRKNAAEQLNCSASTIKNWEAKTIIPPNYNEYIISIVEPNLSFENFNKFIESISRANRIDNMNKEKAKVKGITYCTDFSILKPVLNSKDSLFLVTFYHQVFRSYGYVGINKFLLEIQKYVNWGILTDQGKVRINDINLFLSYYKLNQEAKDYANKMLAAGYSEKDIENKFSTLKFKKS